MEGPSRRKAPVDEGQPCDRRGRWQHQGGMIVVHSQQCSAFARLATTTGQATDGQPCFSNRSAAIDLGCPREHASSELFLSHRTVYPPVAVWMAIRSDHRTA
jgi:hypothetical protein